jgi:hypothetical protein
MRPAIRAGVALFAVLVLAWLALGLRAVRLEEQAGAVVDRARAGQPVSEAEYRQAQDRLQSARELSPDLGPLILEGQLQEAVDQVDAARGTALTVLVDEPENIQGWLLAWRTAIKGVPRDRALARLRELNPFIEVALGLRDCLDCPLKQR